ncbi:MAG TPA: M56 family metallopeptidase [Pirellulales bacterium]|nr:M56 family metallopeptidase [Pirellulales bacterium]
MAAMALAVGLLGRVWKNPQGLHLLWVCVLVKLLLPPLVTIPVVLPVGGVARAPSASGHNASEPLSSSEQSASDNVVTQSMQSSIPQHGVSDIPHPEWLTEMRWLNALAWAWGAGTLGLAIFNCCAVFRFQRALRFAEPAPPAVSGVATAIGHQLRLRRVPNVLTLPIRLSPLVWAIGGRPLVVLPAELCQRLDTAALRTLVVHELAHIRRRDHLVRLLELVTTTLFWWHPVTWLASRRLRELEEECCDAIVISAMPTGIKVYATAIVDTLDFLLEGQVTAPPAATSVKRSVSLTRRLRMLRDNSSPLRLRPGHLLMLAAPLAFTMAVAVAATAPSEAGDQPNAAATGPQRDEACVKPVIGENAAGEKILLEPVVGKNFVILPINTNLQRARGAAYKDAKTFVLINGKGLFNEEDTILDTRQVDCEGLRRAFEAMIHGGVRGANIFRLLVPPFGDAPDGTPILTGEAADTFADHLKLIDTCGKNSVEQIPGNQCIQDWKPLVRELTAPSRADAVDGEAGIGNEQVKVYAVRTPLSRLLLYGDRDDCVIHVIPPVEEAKDVAPTVKRFLPQLKLDKSKETYSVGLLYYAKGSGRGNDTFRHFFGKQEGIWKDIWQDFPRFQCTGGFHWDPDS